MAHAKSKLAETLTRLGLGTPGYSTTGSGPRHEQLFTTEVSAGGEVLAEGTGKTKREAERVAAENALEKLEAQPSAAQDTDETAAGVDEDDSFEGPWPVFGGLLSRTLWIAEKRVPAHLQGEEARTAIRDFTLALYKEVLENLGEVVEEDEDED